MVIPMRDAVAYARMGTQPNPPAGMQLLYPKTDGKWYTRDSAGNESVLAQSATSLDHRAKGVKQAADPNQNFTSGTDTKVTYAFEEYDVGALLSAGTFTVQRSGHWIVTGGALWTGHQVGRRELHIRKNGVEVSWSAVAPGSGNVANWGVTTNWEGAVSAGDIIELWAFQNSGVSLALIQAWCAVHEF